MDVLIQDLRYAFRSLRRSPGYTAVVVTVMALGIAVNVLIFSMVYAVMFRPWPLPDPERIVVVSMTEPKRATETHGLSWQNFMDLRERTKSFSAFGAYWEHVAVVTLDREPERLFGVSVTADVFPALGVRPALGRGFTRDEEVWGRNWNQVVISDHIWRDRFKSDPKVIGRTIRLNGRERAIVGVMPPGFRWPEVEDFWIPAGFNAAEDRRAGESLQGIARLKPGVTAKQASAEVDALVRVLGRQYPEVKDFGGHVVGMHEKWARGAAPVLGVMLLAVVFVLLIACANVANLALARASSRRREISVRLALGASRGRIVRQLLTESVLLSLAGGVLGAWLGTWANAVWKGQIPGEIPFFISFVVDAPVLLYTAGLTVLAGILFGLAPALHGADGRLSDALREGSTQAGTSRKTVRLRSGLVVAEVAFSLVLLVGAGLMIRTFTNLDRTGREIGTDDLLTGRLLVPTATYPTDEDRRRFARALLARLEAEPAVLSASGMSNLPLAVFTSSRLVLTPQMKDPQHDGLNTCVARLLPGALEMMNVPLRRGRMIAASDDERATRVALVSETFARRLFKQADPVGRQIRFAGEPDSMGWRTVVGVVGDIAQNVDLGYAGDPMSSAYVAEYQEPGERLSVLVRTRGDGAAGAAAFRRAVRAIDADLPVENLRSLREQFRWSLWARRLFASTIGVFGALALVIAAVGLYGVMAYSVSQRTKEIGIRMAFGAKAASVEKMVVRQALRLTFIGIGIGLVSALLLTRGMTAVLQGVSPTDPPTYVIVTLLLAFSGLLAAWVPALRATRVDPMVALRCE